MSSLLSLQPKITLFPYTTLFRSKADPLADLVRVRDGVDAADRDRPGRRPQIAGEDPQRGRLAGAVETEEADRLAVLDLERHGTERVLAAVILAQVGDLDHRDPLSQGCETKALY